MLKNRSSRTGFTLPEVLVTVAIVAVLAAIVIPTVTQQISKGDETSLVSSVQTTRSGLTAFVSDVRKFPDGLVDLYAKPAGTALDITGVAYGTAAVARWRGPYLTGSRTAGDTLTVGLAGLAEVLKDSLVGTTNYVVATLGRLGTRALAMRIDSLLGEPGTDSLVGVVRWTPNISGDPVNGHVKVLLMGSR